MTTTQDDRLTHAQFLARHIHKCDLQQAALAILLELGIPTNLSGFYYLKHAVTLYRKQPGKALHKDIYTAVGQLVTPHAGPIQVEQAIRSAIRSGWLNRDDDTWAIYFSRNRSGTVAKPSNGEFISMIGCYLELLEGCCKEVSKDE